MKNRNKAIRVLALTLAMVMVLGMMPVMGLASSDPIPNDDAAVFSGSNPVRLSELLETQDVILRTPGNLGIFTQHSPFEIPAGRTLYIENTLNVQRDAKLIIRGTIVVLEGGRINNQGNSAGGGTIIIAKEGLLLNNGYVENVSNSSVINKGTITNNARFEIRARTLFHNKGIVNGTEPLRIHRDAILAVTLTVARPALLEQYLAEYDIVYVKVPGNIGIFANHSPFIVPANTTLAVKNVLNIHGEIVVEGTLLVLDAGRINNNRGIITVAEGGTLINNGYIENQTNSTVNNAGTLTNNGRFEIRARTTFNNTGTIDGTAELRIHREAILG